ncbi:MAG: transcriptional regulator [Eggerthellaceae bacterium]
MKKSLSIEEFLETRPDITPEMLEEGRLLVEAKIKGYELQQARKACRMTQKRSPPRWASARSASPTWRTAASAHAGGTLRRYITSLGGTLEITAKLPGVSLELQGLGTDHPLFKQEACALVAD